MAKEEIKAGAFTLVALGVLSVFVVLISGFAPWKTRIDYRTRFKATAGVEPGTVVRLNGVSVGQVSRVYLVEDNSRVEVVFGLEEGQGLKEGATAGIARQGLIGDAFLMLYVDQPGGKDLAPGSLVPSVESLDMGEAITSVSRLAGRVEALLSDVQVVINRESMSKLSQSSEKWRTSVDQILTDILTSSAQFQSVVGQLDKFVTRASDVLTEDQGYVRESLVLLRDQLRKADQSLDRLSKLVIEAVEVDQAKIVSVLTKGDRLLDQLGEFITQAGAVMARVDQFVLKADQALGEDQILVRESLTLVRDQLKKTGESIDRLGRLLVEAVETDQAKVAGILGKGDAIMDQAGIIMVQADQIMGQAVGIMGQVDQIVARAGQALDEDQGLVRESLTTLRDRLKKADEAAERLARMITSAVEENQKKAASILSKGERAMEKVEAAASRGDQVLQQTGAVVSKADAVMGRVDEITRKGQKAADISLEEIVATAHNLAEISRNLLIMSQRLRDNPGVLLRPPGGGRP